jgi:hypothetical protein
VNKETEREYIHSFRCLCVDFPNGDLQEHEGPDFLVVTQMRRIGIEVTQIFKTDGKRSLQTIETTKETITVLSQKYAECMELPPAHVSLFFSLNKNLRKDAQMAIAHRIAKVVRDNMPLPGSSVRLEYGKGGVDLVYINRVHSNDRHRWTWPEAGSVLTDAATQLEKAIAEKSEKLDTYLRCCDECWLLIVAPSFKPAGMIHPDEHTLSRTYPSRFSRTYLLDFGRGCLFRLHDNGSHQ